MDERYELTTNPPALAEYLRLRADSGLTPVTPEQGEPALANSWAWASVRERATVETVAMGRLLGDGGWYFMVADMATLPAHQGRGLGRAVLENLLARVKSEVPAGAYVTLMADEAGRPLYRKLGFVETAPHSLGMKLAAGDGPMQQP